MEPLRAPAHTRPGAAAALPNLPGVALQLLAQRLDSLLYSGCSFSAQSSEARPLLTNSILSLLLDQMETGTRTHSVRSPPFVRI